VRRRCIGELQLANMMAVLLKLLHSGSMYRSSIEFDFGVKQTDKGLMPSFTDPDATKQCAVIEKKAA